MDGGAAAGAVRGDSAHWLGDAPSSVRPTAPASAGNPVGTWDTTGDWVAAAAAESAPVLAAEPVDAGVLVDADAEDAAGLAEAPGVEIPGDVAG